MTDYLDESERKHFAIMRLEIDLGIVMVLFISIVYFAVLFSLGGIVAVIPVAGLAGGAVYMFLGLRKMYEPKHD